MTFFYLLGTNIVVVLYEKEIIKSFNTYTVVCVLMHYFIRVIDVGVCIYVEPITFCNREYVWTELAETVSSCP